LTLGTERAGDSLARSRFNRYGVIALFLLPAFLLYGLFVIIPIVQAAHYSLYDWNGLKPLSDFVGLENYQKALSDPIFQKAATHNAIIIVLSLAIQIPFSLGIALMLNRRFPGRDLKRAKDPDGLRAAWAGIEHESRRSEARRVLMGRSCRCEGRGCADVIETSSSSTPVHPGADSA